METGTESLDVSGESKNYMSDEDEVCLVVWK